jgi:hypothetical protein
MSGITDLKATREALLELAEVANHTRRALGKMIADDQGPGRLLAEGRSGQLAKALSHIGEVREGFILSQRNASQITMSELRALVQHILTDWAWLQNFNLALDPERPLEPLGQQLVVYHHALVALAALPRLPAEAITFPQLRPTYRDVPVPAQPGELLARIEEIERMIYRAEIQPVNTLDYGPFRRTYAFFEASSWLVHTYLNPLLGE